MASQGQHGGGSNNSNKREKRGNAAAVPAVSSARPATFAAAQRTPGGAHIVGTVPAPVEHTNRPRSR